MKWGKVVWKEVLEIKNGKNQKKVVDENGEYPIYGSGGVMGYANDYLCEPGTTIIGRKGSINNPIYVKTRFWNVDTAFGLTPKEGLDGRYFYFFCKQYNFLKHNKATTLPSLTKADLLKIQIPLPPLPIQRQIAELLDTATALRQKTEAQLAELDRLAEAVFLEMFGDPVRNEKGWEVSTVERVCEKIYGGGTPSKSKPEYYTGTIPWVTPKDMKVLNVRTSRDKITLAAVENSSAKLIPEGSILMVIRSGILKHTLPVAINKVEVAVNQDMKAFIVDNRKAETTYILHFFLNVQVYLLSKVRAVTADNIEFKQIRDLKIPLPPLPLQTHFAQIIENLEAQKALLRRSLQESEDLLGCLLQEVFS